jgi:hypothetical protein
LREVGCRSPSGWPWALDKDGRAAMKPGDTVIFFYWNVVQKGTVVGVFGNNVLARLKTRNGEPSVIKIIIPIKRTTLVEVR